MKPYPKQKHLTKYLRNHIIVSIAIFIVLLILFFASCSNPQTATPPESSTTILTGLFSECEIDSDSSYIIRWDASLNVSMGYMQIHQGDDSRKSFPYYECWEFDTGMITFWYYDMSQVVVDDPHHYLLKGKWTYRIVLW